MEAPEHVIDKVRRLLRLAESANEHEAAAAAARAQELMTRHRIELAALDVAGDEEVELNETPVDEFGRMVWWRHILASAVAEANGCRIITNRRRGSVRELLVGTRSDAELARGLYFERGTQHRALASAASGGAA